jgi:hypothetical protein
MTADERMAEVCQMLGNGLARLKTKMDAEERVRRHEQDQPVTS